MTREATSRTRINRHSVSSSEVHLVDHSCLKVRGPALEVGATPVAQTALGAVAAGGGWSIEPMLPRGGGPSAKAFFDTLPLAIAGRRGGAEEDQGLLMPSGDTGR